MVVFTADDCWLKEEMGRSQAKPKFTAAKYTPDERRSRKLQSIGAALARSLRSQPSPLRYISHHHDGIQRLKRGGGFIYLRPNGQRVSREDLLRIRALAIPPAWRDVWICPKPEGHLQAVGWDARGRKQYRYHPDWRAIRDSAKYGKLRPFAERLPAIRRQVARDLALPGLSRDKILATIVRLLDTTLIRVGNDVYAKENHSFGLATMHDRHVSVAGSTIQFSFRGKSGIHHQVELDDRHLAQIIRQSRDLPGYELFQYLDAEGRRRSVHASDVNDYLKRIGGQDITAKDFRTWAGTVLAVQFLQGLPPAESSKEAKRNIARAIESVAHRLRNTKTVCRQCYIHPTVLESYLEGDFTDGLMKSHGHQRRLLSLDECVVVQMLSRRPRARLTKAA